MQRFLTKGVLAIVFMAVGGLGYHAWLTFGPGAKNIGPLGGEREDADRATRAPRTKVDALARFKPSGGVVDVSGMAGERIGVIKVKEGDTVKQGDVLAILESNALRQLEFELAQTQFTEAQTRAQVEKNYAEAILQEASLAQDQLQLQDLDIEAHKSKIQLLEKNLALAKKDQERLEGLDHTIVSDREKDHQAMLVEQSQAELAAAEKLLKKMEFGRQLSTKEAEAKQKQAMASKARAEVAVQLESARRQMDISGKRVELSVVRAPSDGMILQVILHEGEVFSQRPLLRMANTMEMLAIAEVYEEDVRMIKTGQPCTITSPALSKPLAGTVERIGQVVGNAGITSLDPAARTDMRIVEVVIRMRESQEAASFINLQVTASIETSQESGKFGTSTKGLGTASKSP